MSVMKGKRRIAAKADKVSMVTRAASRLPFRVMKGSGDDVDGIDLALLFKGTRSEKTEDVAEPQIVAILVNASVKREAADRVVKGAGFDTDKVTETDDGLIYAQAEGDVGPITMLKVSDQVGVAVANVAKGFCEYDTEDLSFSERVRVSGVYSMMGLARDVMGSLVYDALYKADNPAEASTEVGKAIDTFKGYVTEMIAALPVKVFKAEAIQFEDTDMNIDTSRPDTLDVLEPKKVEKTDESQTAATGADSVTGEGSKDTITTGAGDDSVAKGDESQTEGAEGADTVAGGAADDKVEAEVKKEDAPGLDVNAIAAAVAASMAPKLDALQQSVSDLGARVESVETVAKEDRERLGKIVPGLAPTEKVVSKSEATEASVPHIDTGLGLYGDP